MNPIQAPTTVPSIDRSTFDFDCQSVYSDAMSIHKSSAALKTCLTQATYNADQSNQAMIQESKCFLSYEQLLSTQLTGTEAPLMNGIGIDFVSYTENGLSLPGGRLMLTDRRLVVMSATRHSSKRLAKVGDPKRSLGYYELTSALQDCCSFRSYNLRYCKKINFQVMVGDSFVTPIHPTQKSCCGFLQCCFEKFWSERTANRWNSNTRSVVIGLICPISGVQVLTFQVSPAVPLDYVNMFVAEFNRILLQATP